MGAQHVKSAESLGILKRSTHNEFFCRQPYSETSFDSPLLKTGVRSISALKFEPSSLRSLICIQLRFLFRIQVIEVSRKQKISVCYV